MYQESNNSQDLVLNKISPLLSNIDPDTDYGNWIKVLMVIFHETGGSQSGLDVADGWSSKGCKYKGRKDIEYRWNRFNINYKNPVRIGTLIRMAKM